MNEGEERSRLDLKIARENLLASGIEPLWDQLYADVQTTSKKLHDAYGRDSAVDLNDHTEAEIQTIHQLCSKFIH